MTAQFGSKARQMIILLTGATGFIGLRLAQALQARGHRVIRARRRASHADELSVDFTTDVRVEDWLPRLVGVDAVINTVGIIREQGEQTFQRLHTDAPQALFQACAQSGVRRVIQVSALGAAAGATPYFSSKRAADDFLMRMPVQWSIVRPSLVYGLGGTSASLFNTLASLPLLLLPGHGEQKVQPVYIDDLVDAVVNLVADDAPFRQIVPIVGPQAVALCDFLGRLRMAMGLGAPRFVPVPMVIMRMAAWVGELSRRTLLDRDTLTMLEAGNTGDASWTRRLLGREPRAPESFIDPSMRAAAGIMARLTWLLPLLRICIAIVWIWTGVVSLGLYPVAASYELLARTGLTGPVATVALYGAAGLDFCLGLATLLVRRRRLLWIAQMTLIVSYTVIISIRLPEFWLHPYGPVLKNLPMLAGIYLLFSLERVQWNTSS
jgi:uncharacterized protein YbjT (DUF2867 family)